MSKKELEKYCDNLHKTNDGLNDKINLLCDKLGVKIIQESYIENVKHYYLEGNWYHLEDYYWEEEIKHRWVLKPISKKK